MDKRDSFFDCLREIFSEGLAAFHVLETGQVVVVDAVARSETRGWCRR